MSAEGKENSLPITTFDSTLKRFEAMEKAKIDRLSKLKNDVIYNSK